MPLRDKPSTAAYLPGSRGLVNARRLKWKHHPMPVQLLTQEQFRAQFDTRIEILPEQQKMLFAEQTIDGYTIYRLLDRLILLDPADGHFYIHVRWGEVEET